MTGFFDTHGIAIGERCATPFCAANNNYQDGTTPMYRDAAGRLWAMSGHSHVGAVGVFAGTCLDDMKKLYDVELNFCVGSAEYAFDGVRYPEGVRARGSIWPFGLYICPSTHRFFCLFHNETGWSGRGTAYDAFGPCETPRGDSDFRHVGLMHSDDEGRTWSFDHWVLTAEQPCFTERYVPGAGAAPGQRFGDITLGSGDFSLYVEPNGEYMYIFYNIIHFDMARVAWNGCHVYAARARKRSDGMFGGFVKYYDGSFCESGTMGRETPIVLNAWHPRVVHAEKYGIYVMTSSSVTPGGEKLVDDIMAVRTSGNLLDWSEPRGVEYGGAPFGNHYLAMVRDGAQGQPNVIPGDEFSILSNHNGTDVIRYKARFTEK